eukprot:1182216-Prorocentrum_minimum.AAC.2
MRQLTAFCLGDVLTEVYLSREGKNFQIPVDSIPVDLLIRSYGEEWKRAFELQETSFVHGT